jgi:short-subunit dehydrogenase
LVTGASSGLGAQFARRLAERGLSLVLSARSADKLATLAGELGSSHGVGTRVVAADLSTAAGIDRLIDEVSALGVPIDHLIGNAGFGTHGAFVESDPSEQRAMVTLNCEAIVALTRALLPGMLERGRGGVINVASTAGFQPAGTFATYAATKAFVLHFTEALHEEARGAGVRVMALCPGPVPTGFQERASFRIAPAQRWMTMSAAQTVDRALADYERGAAVCIPGALNHVGATLASLGPRPLVRRLTYALMRSAARRAE